MSFFLAVFLDITGFSSILRNHFEGFDSHRVHVVISLKSCLGIHSKNIDFKIVDFDIASSQNGNIQINRQKSSDFFSLKNSDSPQFD